MTRCATGSCCEAFYLPIDKQTLAKWRFNPESIPEKFKSPDVRKVVDMILPLGRYSTSPANGGVPDENGNWYYTCKWFDKETKNCTNYKYRPLMCSAYPYQNKCEYKGCTYSNESS